MPALFQVRFNARMRLVKQDTIGWIKLDTAVFA
jgi:hypothetical protein